MFSLSETENRRHECSPSTHEGKLNGRHHNKIGNLKLTMRMRIIILQKIIEILDFKISKY